MRTVRTAPVAGSAPAGTHADPGLCPRSRTVWLLRSPASTWPAAMTNPIDHSRNPSALRATMPPTLASSGRDMRTV